VAWLHVATRTLDRFVPTAERLGCEWWKPVVAMAETALAGGRAELAGQVFAAATSRPGMHRDMLIRRCEQLTDSRPPARPRLRIVE
jgi:hypothetical protein